MTTSTAQRAPSAPAQHAVATPDFAGIKLRQQATWASGDFAIIGVTLQIVGESLAEAVDVRAGERVLDVAAGNGNATLAAARRFADVTSTDYVPDLLGKGRIRAAAEKRDVVGGSLVLRGQSPKPAPRFHFGPRAGDVEQPVELQILRNRVEQAIDRVDADHAHGLDFYFNAGSGEVGDRDQRTARIVAVLEKVLAHFNEAIPVSGLFDENGHGDDVGQAASGAAHDLIDL